MSVRANQRQPHTRSSPPQGANQPHTRLRGNPKEKANIFIASLNVNGATAPTQGMSCIDKWTMINRTIFNEKIAILALQETHLDQTLFDQVNACFGKNLEIINSPLPTNPRSSAGVAFIINKALIRPNDLSVMELIPGRATMLKLRWLESCEAAIVNIYAPNGKNDQITFWTQVIEKRRTARLPLPDFVLGDFNITEDAIDRSPAHLDDAAAIDAMREVRRAWNIQDTWRHHNPDTRAYTYHANVNGSYTQSRLDRVYTTQDVAQHVFDWQMKPSAVPTDHWLVKVKFAPRDAPLIGNGRWTWPLYLLKNENLIKKVDQRGTQLLTDLSNLRTRRPERSLSTPQTLWETFKEDITILAKEVSRNSYHKLNSRIKGIESDLHSLQASPDFDVNESARTNAAFLANELEHLERVRAKNQSNKLRANLANRNERLGGKWSAMSKVRKPRDLILQLKVPESNPTQYERCTKRMVDLARKYHENIQTDDTQSMPSPEWEMLIREVLGTIPASQHMPEPERSHLNWAVSEVHI